MENETMVGIYKITSPSGKIYIGQSNNLIQRQKDYIKTIHCKGQVRLYNSIRVEISCFRNNRVL